MDNSAIFLSQLLSKYSRLEKVLIGERQTSKKKQKEENSVQYITKNIKLANTSGEVVFFTQMNPLNYGSNEIIISYFGFF